MFNLSANATVTATHFVLDANAPWAAFGAYQKHIQSNIKYH